MMMTVRRPERSRLLTLLAELLEVARGVRKPRRELGEEGRIEHLEQQSEDDGDRALVAHDEAASGREEHVRDHVGPLRDLFERHEHVESLARLEEVGRHRRGVHDDDVDAERAHLRGDGRGEQREERLRARVQRRERVREEARRGRRVREQPAPARRQHLVEEVVGDRDGARGVAVVVGEPLAKRHVLEEADADEAGVVEEEGDVDVARRVDNRLHVHLLVLLGERDAHLAELQVRVLCDKLSVEVVEQVVLQRDDDHVDALLDELLHDRSANSRAPTRHHRPLRVIPLGEVVRHARVDDQVLHEQDADVRQHREEADHGEGREQRVRGEARARRRPHLTGQRQQRSHHRLAEQHRAREGDTPEAISRSRTGDTTFPPFCHILEI
eukprot:CAMPEP_0119436220 /NCGR_PEP_ID=MMETSP1335-20130426/51559_1 /TAXON_ID=259385 /ORGANISM="Chrysoculter rhomboideus, Strain RCC1486" /LENGTH=384 /DNA_ID=CAMNT_0007462085 /DNA_START=40 /DNA_END=1194 /DNA_ORIENTATION=+